MSVSPLVWILTVVAILGLLAFDYVFHVRKAHIPSLREAAVWSAVYVGIALLFGVGVLALGGVTMGTEYFAGYVTEKALSVDNLFVFLVIMSAFSVPREDQQKVLLFGITFAIVARTGMIFLGAAAIEAFSWAFYLFGAILLYTAVQMIRGELKDDQGEEKENIFVRAVRAVVPATDEFDGDKLTTIVNGRRVLTPMLLVMIAIGGTDLLFALDSVPAIFGLTQNTYIVFTATVFSLLGLRQLYFLIDGLLDRLVYLSYGLSVILAFIGVKLVIHALHENELGIINGGEPVHAIPEITTGLSLSVIIGILVVTVAASLLSPRGRAQAAVNNAHREAQAYIEMTYSRFEEERDELYQRMRDHERTVRDLPAKHQDIVVQERTVLELLSDAHTVRHRRALDREAGERSDELPERLVVTWADGTVATDSSGNVVTLADQEAAQERQESAQRSDEEARSQDAVNGR